MTPAQRDHRGRDHPQTGAVAPGHAVELRRVLWHPLPIAAALTVFGLVVLAPFALVVLVYDGFIATAAIAAASSAALWLVPLLRLGPLPWRWHALLAMAFGLGGLSLLVLGFGCTGWLQRPLWLGILAALSVAGLARIAILARRAPQASAPDDDHSPPPSVLKWLTLLVVPFAILAFDVATVPPGFLWTPEGFGYDALIYHLELPKEYLADGRITYRPHNVYAGFPSNVEMLFLLAMILRGDAIDGAITAQMFNLAFAVLTVVAIWVAAREWSRAAGLAAVIVMGTVAWLPYLCGVAFVENGLLFFGAVACAALIRMAKSSGFRVQFRTAEPATQNSGLRTQHSGLVVLAGLMCGLAAGCKYTGVTLIALPIGVGILLVPARGFIERVKRGAIFAIAAFVSFSPWLIKNAAFTGNPVFPLASSVFDAYPPGWGAAEAQHFDECHRPRPYERPLPARLQLLWRQVIVEEHGLFGTIILLAPLALLIPGLCDAGSRRAGCLLGSVVGVQLVSWLVGTHLYSRFAVVMIIPLGLLAALAVASTRAKVAGSIILALVTVGLAINFARFVVLYRDHFYAAGPRLAVEGATQFFISGEWPGYQHLAEINRDLPADARILMLGDARAFYFQRSVEYYVVFNRNPFVEAIRANPDPTALVGWLRQRGYSHVLVNWLEIERLRRSAYGFPPEVNPELFVRLASAGLRQVKTFDLPETNRPYAELFEVRR